MSILYFQGWSGLQLSPEDAERVREAVERMDQGDEACLFFLSPAAERTTHDTELLLEHVLACKACAMQVAIMHAT